MAGHNFDPLDIRSEMGYKEDVAPVDTTSDDVVPVTGLEIVHVEETHVPLEKIAPGEPGNETDLDNPPDFSMMHQMFPPQ